MECHSGGLFHASDTALQKLDQVHHHFLRELGVDARQAFTEFNFASPVLRRNIGILGLLHKRVLGLSHPIFQRLLPFHMEVFGSLLVGITNNFMVIFTKLVFKWLCSVNRSLG